MRKLDLDARLERLLDEATPEQLRRMYDLSGFLLRREGKLDKPKKEEPKK